MQRDEWVTSSFSNGSGGNQCVEVRVCSNVDAVLVRNSKHRAAGWTKFTGAEWEAFLAGVKAGEFDLGDG